jgi:hypothetical protein
MESILWALDLCAVVYLCLWVLKQEKRKEQELREKERRNA